MDVQRGGRSFLSIRMLNRSHAMLLREVHVLGGSAFSLLLRGVVRLQIPLGRALLVVNVPFEFRRGHSLLFLSVSLLAGGLCSWYCVRCSFRSSSVCRGLAAEDY